MITTRPLRSALCSALSLALVAGCGDVDPATGSGLGNDTFHAPVAITRGGGYRRPTDAAPSPDGATVYFTADRASGGAGVFRVPAAGGDAAEVAAGAPFVAPAGLALSSDGRTLYVADPRAGSGGALLTLPAAGGTPTTVPMTEGSAPRGVEVVAQQGGDAVYFTGVRDGEPAVLRIAPGGGAPAVVLRGAPLRNPSGVTATRAGVAFVSDRVDPATGTGSVYRIENGQATVVASDVRLGDPAGVALSPDERVLGVSSHDPARGTCQVLLVDLATMRTGVFNRVIDANHSAGGVHRAHGGTSTDLAWADLTAGTVGHVYRISFK